MIKEKLDSAWQTDKTMDSIFEFRALAQNAFGVLMETVSKIDEIASSTNFQDVDSEIKQTGAAIRKILKDAKDALEIHGEFIAWQQPEQK